MPHITVLPMQRSFEAEAGANLLNALRVHGFPVNAPCGGVGTCGKCTVLLDGEPISACQTTVTRDMTITLPKTDSVNILTEGWIPEMNATISQTGFFLAFDIGTTTVAGYLLDDTGREIATVSALNPQHPFGADVITRIQLALKGNMTDLTRSIRSCLQNLTAELCKKARISPDSVTMVSFVGNPAMQQLFLGIQPDNLVKIPFSPVLTEGRTVSAGDYLPILKNADMRIVPDISGYVGADTVACILATEMDQKEDLTLLVDIGTNGEMVLGNRHRLVACATAAGPALEGANIRCGMRGQVGAIDHVWQENGQFSCSVIGGGEAKGVCGSGLIDAVAAALNTGLLNSRGNILNDTRTISLAKDVYLTQEDIRQVQMAKGAIAAGIELMAKHLEIQLENIQRVYLAGAFGTFMDPRSACRIGLLPPTLLSKIQPIGNAAGSGAKLLACRKDSLRHADTLTNKVEFLELASIPGFQRCFAKNMRF